MSGDTPYFFNILVAVSLEELYIRVMYRPLNHLGNVGGADLGVEQIQLTISHQTLTVC